MKRTRSGTVTAVSLLVVVGVFAGFAGTAGGGHGAKLGNYTVTFPEAHDQYPRSENPDGTHSTTIHHYAGFTPELYETAGTPKGTEQLRWIWVKSQDIDFSQCTSTDTRAFGIDRDGDDPGTVTDTDLITYMEASHFNDNSIYVDFYEGDELGAVDREDKGGYGEGQGEGREDGDGNAEVYADDEIIAVQEECYGMPEEPSWYQIDAGGNGTGFNGQEGTIFQTSHYFYVCTCDNEQEAREELGPPPSELEDASTDDVTETPVADATATPGTDVTATPVADETATPVVEETATANQADGTENAGSSRGDGGGDAATATGRPAADDQGNDRPQVSPTVVEGPGFGALFALVGLLGGALLVARRD